MVESRGRWELRRAALFDWGFLAFLRAWIQGLALNEVGMVAHIDNPSVQDVEPGELEVQI